MMPVPSGATATDDVHNLEALGLQAPTDWGERFGHDFLKGGEGLPLLPLTPIKFFGCFPNSSKKPCLVAMNDDHSVAALQQTTGSGHQFHQSP